MTIRVQVLRRAPKLRRLESLQEIHLSEKPWCRWLPRSYLLVLVINATATLLLWPADAEFFDPCPLKFRLLLWADAVEFGSRLCSSLSGEKG